MGRKDTSGNKADKRDVAGKRITTTDVAYYDSLLSNTNVQAFLKVIRDGEGTAGSNGYTILVGKELFFYDFSKHPNKLNKALNSTAAGAYQFTYKSWIWDRDKLGLRDFTPHSQDIAALYEINKKGALNDVLQGDIESAITKTIDVWRSLPGAKHDAINKRSITSTRATEVYEKNGGVLHGPAQSTLNGLSGPSNSKSAILDSIPFTFPAAVADLIDIAKPQNPGAYLSPITPGLNKGSNMYKVEYMQINTLSDPKGALFTIKPEGKLVNKEALKNGYVDFTQLEGYNTIPIKGQPDRKSPYLGKEKSLLTPIKLKTQWTKPELDNYFKTQDSINSAPFTFPFTKPGRMGTVQDAVKPNTLFDTARIYKPKDSFGSKTPASINIEKAGSNSGVNRRQHNNNGTESNNVGRTVNINLNTPMIGQFTINTKDTRTGLNDLKHQVEEVLIEVLNSANTI